MSQFSGRMNHKFASLYEYQQDVLGRYLHLTSNTVPISYMLLYPCTPQKKHRVTLEKVGTSPVPQEQLQWAKSV